MRVILHADLDCFYAQVEQVRLKLDSSIPIVVQQWSSLLAVNYSARGFGVTRHMNIIQARQKCPSLVSVHTCAYELPKTAGSSKCDLKVFKPNEAPPDPQYHKVSLDFYRQASKGIFKFLRTKFGNRVEKASVDEAFINVSEDVEERLESEFPDFPEWADSSGTIQIPKDVELDWNGLGKSPVEINMEEKKPTIDEIYLWVGALIARELREDLFEELGYTCSIGIAQNKTLAKLATSHNKPYGQTIVLPKIVPEWMKKIPFDKIRFLGGKLGQQILNPAEDDEDEDADDAIAQEERDNKPGSVVFAGDLWGLSVDDLALKVGGDLSLARWVYNIIRGQDDSQVKPRALTKSFLSAKSFRPAITKYTNEKEKLLERWLIVLANELCHRLEEEAVDTRRWPRTLTLTFKRVDMPSSRSRATEFPFPPQQSSLNSLRISEFIEKRLVNPLYDSLFPLVFLGLTLGRFIEEGDFKTIKSMDQFIIHPDQPDDDSKSSESTRADLLLFPTEEKGSKNKKSRTKEKQSSNGSKTILDFFHNVKDERNSQQAMKSSKANLYKCPKCGRELKNEEFFISEHQDYHHAMRLAGLDDS